MIEGALIASRLVHYAALSVLFGEALFLLYAAGARRRWLAPAALLALLSGLAWLALATATMVGDPDAAIDPTSLWSVIHDLPFGRIWAVRLLLAVVVLAAILLDNGRWSGIIAVLAGALLASIALTGHTQVETGPKGLLHVLADALHLLAAGAWLGALGPLVGLAAAARTSAQRLDLGKALARFSNVGVTAVGVLIATGAVNAWLLVGSLNALVATGYGRLLALKLLLFAAMLAFAAANRFWISSALAAPTDDEAGARWLARLRRNVLVEQVLGLLVLTAVSVLGNLAARRRLTRAPSRRRQTPWRSSVSIT